MRYEYWRENIMDERLEYLDSDEKYELYLRWYNEQRYKFREKVNYNISDERMRIDMRYFEIEFDNDPRNQEGHVSDMVGEYSICILGDDKPTIQEAAEFCKADMKRTGYKYVVNVLEIDREEAHKFFEMERENEFPVFRKKKKVN